MLRSPPSHAHLALLLAIACGDAAPTGLVPDAGGMEEPTLEDLWRAGRDRYLGAFVPSTEEALGDGVRRFGFAVPDDPAAESRGPLCLRGTEFTVETREGSSDELLIWLQEGGACWDAFCAAVEETSDIFDEGILDPELADNPLGDHDLVYVPYCDGSLFAGDVDRDLPPSLVGTSTSGFTPSFQRGLQNLSAALDVALRQFPSPTRIVLAGASGGAFGTLHAAPLVRRVYPEPEILVINDSGVGIARDGEPAFIDGLLREWNAEDAVPSSCVDCTAGGHILGLVEWHLEVDSNLRVAPITHTRDQVIGRAFLMEEPERFEAAILRETGALAARFPNRYRRFLQAGDNHSVLLNAGPPEPFPPFGRLGGLQEEIVGVSALAWVTAAVAGSNDWRDTVDPSLE